MKIVIETLIPLILAVALTLEAPKMFKFVVENTFPRIHRGLGNMEKFNDALTRKR